RRRMTRHHDALRPRLGRPRPVTVYVLGEAHGVLGRTGVWLARGRGLRARRRRRNLDRPPHRREDAAREQPERAERQQSLHFLTSSNWSPLSLYATPGLMPSSPT